MLKNAFFILAGLGTLHTIVGASFGSPVDVLFGSMMAVIAALAAEDIK